MCPVLGSMLQKQYWKNVSEKAWKATSEKGRQFGTLDFSKQRSRSVLIMICKH